MPEAEQTWLTVRELASLLGIGRTKAYELITSERDLEVIRIGRSLRVSRNSVDRWTRKHRVHDVELEG